MTITAKYKKTENIIRYVRPLAMFKDILSVDNLISYSNLGGVTLVFDIDHEVGLLTVNYSVCMSIDNFDKHEAVKIALNRKNTKESLVIPYDDSLTLIDNLLVYLQSAKLTTNLARTLRKEMIDICLFNDEVVQEYDFAE